MSFPKAKRDGWTNDASIVTAGQLATMDTQPVSALDGTAGGTYANTYPIEVAGEGIRDSQFHIDDINPGPVIRSGERGIRQRVKLAGAGTGSTFTVDTTYDIWILTINTPVTHGVELRNSGSPSPSENDVVWVCTEPGSVLDFLTISDADDPLPNYLTRVYGFTDLQAKFSWASFIYRSGAWEVWNGVEA